MDLDVIRSVLAAHLYRYDSAEAAHTRSAAQLGFDLLDHIATLEQRVATMTEALESIVVATAGVNSRRSQRSRRIHAIAAAALAEGGA